MQSSKTSTIFKVLAASEMLGDKFPNVPDRIEPGGLLSRSLSGALVGATLSCAQRKEDLIGAGTGFISALVSTYGKNLQTVPSCQTFSGEWWKTL